MPNRPVFPLLHRRGLLPCLTSILVCATLGAQDRGHTRSQNQSVDRPSPSQAGPGFGGSSQPGSPRSGNAQDSGFTGNPGFQRRGNDGPQANRPASVPRPASNTVYRPQAMVRCLERPTATYWQHRDLFAEMRAMARRGFIEVIPVADEVNTLTSYSWFPSGWRGFAFAVPAKEKLHVRLHHGNEGWFRLVMVDKWGQTGAGMLQNLIPTGNPEVTYNNPTNLAQAVYVIVDDPGWMSSEKAPFNLTIERSWDPATKKAPPMPQVVGIWASRPAPAKPAEAPAAPAVS